MRGNSPDWFCLQEDLSKETLLKQFKIVKAHTNTSHVMEYGNKVRGWGAVTRANAHKHSGKVSSERVEPPPKAESRFTLLRLQEQTLASL